MDIINFVLDTSHTLVYFVSIQATPNPFQKISFQKISGPGIITLEPSVRMKPLHNYKTFSIRYCIPAFSDYIFKRTNSYHMNRMQT